jgi:hypothetical protein
MFKGIEKEEDETKSNRRKRERSREFESCKLFVFWT